MVRCCPSRYSFPALDHETVKEMRELGLLGVPFPEAWGGTGLDYLAYTIVVAAPAESGWQLLSLPLPSGPPVLLHASPRRVYPDDHSPDGRTLVFQELHPERGWDLKRLDLDVDGRPTGPPRDLVAPAFVRDPATGRPTKRDRRQLDRFRFRSR